MTRVVSRASIVIGLILTAGVFSLPGCQSDDRSGGGGGGASSGGAGGHASGAGGGTAAAGGAGGHAADCPSLGSVTFHLQAPLGAPAYTYARSFGDPGDGFWWYSVATADGTPLQIFLPTQAATTCGACQQALLPIGFACSALPAEGIDGRWNGTAIAGQSSCSWSGSSPPSPIACSVLECMPAGRYVATMCAYTSSLECSNGPGDDRGTCVSVPFDYPTTSVVVGTLPQ